MNTKQQANEYAKNILVRRIDPHAVPGFWVKRLRLGPHQWAIVRRAGHIQTVHSRTLTVGGFLQSSPQEVAVVEIGTFSLHPYVGDLMSADDHLMEAEFLVQVKVTDPESLYQTLGAERKVFSLGDLEGWIASEVRGLLSRVVRQYTAHDLTQVDAIAERVAGELRSFLQTDLSPMGLDVLAVRHVIFLRAEDAVKRAEALRRLQEQLRNTEFRARVKEIQDTEEFMDTLEQILHERAIRRLFRREELEDLLTEIKSEEMTNKEESFPQPDSALPEANRERAKERQVLGRWDALRARLGLLKQEECREPSSIEKLERWVTLLRALGTIVFFGTTLLAILMPDLFESPEIPRLITAAVGFFLGILAFISALWLKRKVKARRVLEQQEKALAQMNPEQRRQVERLVRERIAAALQRVESNLQEAWTNAYRKNRYDIAKRLRAMAQKTVRLLSDVKEKSHPQASLIADRFVTPDQIQAWLDLNENLLVQADELSDLSARLYQDVVQEHWGTVEDTAQYLEIHLQEVQSRLAQRETLMKGV